MRRRAWTTVALGLLAMASPMGWSSYAVAQGYVAHVASVRQPDGVRPTFDEIGQKYPTLFAGKSVLTSSVTLASGATWHRVLVGDMARLEDAEGFCRVIQSLGHDYCKVQPAGQATRLAGAPVPPPPPASTPSPPPPAASFQPEPVRIAQLSIDKPDNLVRRALVIGISSYAHVPVLINPGNDAKAIATALEIARFDSVQRLENPSLAELRAALAVFAQQAAGSDVALVYFAGHGLEIEGQNYLIPRDASITTPDSVRQEALSLADLLASIEGARKLKLVVLDACRDNPFIARLQTVATRSLSVGGKPVTYNKGLAPIATGQNTLVAYAAKHGSTAIDGDGRNSPYATALLDVLSVEGVETGLLFRQVRDKVLVLTGRAQEPFTYGSMSGEAIFLRPTQGGLTLPENSGRYGDFERETVNRMRAVARLIGNKDFAKLALFVHPVRGMRVTPDSNVDLNADQVITRAELLDPTSLARSRVWGIEVSDRPIKGTFAEYIANWAYKRDYALSTKASFMDRNRGAGEYTNNIYAVYPGSLVVDLHLPGQEKYAGMDWSSLRLVFQQYNGKWFLVGMLNAQWNP